MTKDEMRALLAESEGRMISAITTSVTRNVTRDVTANVTRSVTQDVTANVTRKVTQDVTASVTKNITAAITREVTTTVTKNVTASLTEAMNYQMAVFFGQMTRYIDAKFAAARKQDDARFNRMYKMVLPAVKIATDVKEENAAIRRQLSRLGG